MRLHRLIFTGMLITIMAVGYVHQRIEIVKTAYKLQKNRNYLSMLIDQNSNLSYNLSKLEAPSNLLAALNKEEIEFAGNRNISHNRYLLSRADIEARLKEAL